jgi:hypothetical protein
VACRVSLRESRLREHRAVLLRTIIRVMRTNQQADSGIVVLTLSL